MMNNPDLSHRIGDALGTHMVSVDERRTITAAMDKAQAWAELPADVQALVEQIEKRPYFGE